MAEGDLQIRWTDEELKAAVLAYRAMMQHEAERKSYSKVGIYRDLAARYGRTVKAFEYRMQNISAILHEENRDWLNGLMPAGNVGAKMRPRLAKLIEAYLYELPSPKTTMPLYKEKLPALRDWLVNVARRNKVVTYGEIMSAFSMNRFALRFGLGFLGNQSLNYGEPVLTALVVNKQTRLCGTGFWKEFEVDEVVERKNLFAYWQTHENEVPVDSGQEDSLAVRAAKFVSVEARPAQAAFRRKLFDAYGGKCAISGCNIVETLDAAHKTGRDWRKHNEASDGILLRKDLHALYDKNLIQVDAKGRITVGKDAMAYYKQFEGLRIANANM
jgi:hypothetical protein